MNFFDQLRKSPWKCAVSEAGMGVPFQSELLARDGASKTLIYGECPYGKQFFDDGLRAVSEERARMMAHNMLSLDPDDGSPFFGIGVTASYKTEKEMGESHGWIVITAPNRECALHFRIREGIPRPDAIRIAGEVTQWFVEHAILMNCTEWGNSGIPTGAYVDVIAAPGLKISDMLSFCKEQNPLVFHNGGFHRAMDYIRGYSDLYFGSFNPPTVAHEALMCKATERHGKCMWGMSFHHMKKGRPSRYEMADRIRMIAEVSDQPILIMDGINLFREYAQALCDMSGKPEITFHVGYGVMEKIAQTAPDELGCLGDVAKFVTYIRQGSDLPTGPAMEDLHVEPEYILDESLFEVSSSNARSDHSLVSQGVSNYIAEKQLYREK